MSDEEILRKAIEKAVNNGWNEGKQLIDFTYFGSFLEPFEDIKFEHPFIEVDGEDIHTNVILFDHKFAKAFFGEFTINRIGPGMGKVSWKFHLPILVLEEHPLQYLAKFL